MQLHLSWLEQAIINMKNTPNKLKVVDGEMTIEEFIKMYCKEELSKLHRNYE